MCFTSQLRGLGALQGFPPQASSDLWHQVTASLTLCYASSASQFTEEEIGLGCYHIPAQALPFSCSGTLIMKEVLVLLLYNCPTHSAGLDITLSEFLLVFPCSLERDSILNQTTEHSPSNKICIEHRVKAVLGLELLPRSFCRRSVTWCICCLWFLNSG